MDIIAILEKSIKESFCKVEIIKAENSACKEEILNSISVLSQKILNNSDKINIFESKTNKHIESLLTNLNEHKNKIKDAS